MLKAGNVGGEIVVNACRASSSAASIGAAISATRICTGTYWAILSCV